jgi:hypothetical protein
MLSPNLVFHTLRRLQAAVLHNRTVRIVDGLRCPYCDTTIRASDPEETGNGNWRILCGGCHRDILVVEESR